MIDLLVIGYGNTLRSDDGAGPAVAAAVDARALRGVRTMAVHQLTPELVIEIGRYRCVVFVDAAVDVPTTRIDSIAGCIDGGPVMTHHVDPAGLLALARSVGSGPEEAVQVSIPAENLEFGEALSETTRAGILQAVEAIVDLASRTGRSIDTR